jgi:hypothetical protein
LPKSGNYEVGFTNNSKNNTELIPLKWYNIYTEKENGMPIKNRGKRETP